MTTVLPYPRSCRFENDVTQLAFGHWEVHETELIRPDGVENHATDCGADHLLIGFKRCFLAEVRVDEVDVVVHAECAVATAVSSSFASTTVGDACPPLA